MAGPSLAHLKHSIEPMSSDLIGTSGSTGIFDADVSDSIDRLDTDIDTDIGAFHLMDEPSQQSTSAGGKDKKRAPYLSGLGQFFKSSAATSKSTRQHFSEQAFDREESYVDNQLPVEVIEKIIFFLSPLEIYNLSATNRFFRSL